MTVVMTIIQMKFEHQHIIYEATFSRRPFGVLFDQTVCFSTEIGLDEMKLYFQKKCEEEQHEAQEYYNFILVEQWNRIISAITVESVIEFRFLCMYD